MPEPTIEPKQARSHATRRRLLDAAVEVLVDQGYAGISAAYVARRAGVSRGAHQHHFANRQAMVVEAVRHMSAQELAALSQRIAALPRGRSRVEGALDFIFDMYSGRFFGAIIELSLAARREPELIDAVADEEESMTHTVRQLGEQIFGEAFADRELGHRWMTVIATIRGLAMLRLLRHPQATIDRQWRHARRLILEDLARAQDVVAAARAISARAGDGER